MIRWLPILLLLPLQATARPDGQLPAYLLELPASVSTVLVAETDEATMHRLENRPDGIHYVDERYMSIGQNGVGKEQPWDRRTPLGVYFVTERMDTSRLHERYGPVAFPLDYPNIWDRRNHRGGDGIWLHGVDRRGGQRPPLDTDGCLALPNEEILALEPVLEPTRTPVIIAREVRWADPADIEALRAEVRSAVDAWAESIRSGDLHRYLSLYADEFTYRGMTRTRWAEYRVATLGARAIEDLQLDDVALLADPEEDGLFVSRFEQVTIEAGRKVVTTKRLYWKRDSGGELRVVAEDNG
jgi:ketosteroid isomerase-like protein